MADGGEMEIDGCLELLNAGIKHSNTQELHFKACVFSEIMFQ